MSTPAVKKIKTLSDFRAEHDPSVKIPNKIRDALESLVKEGQEAWEYEADFIRRCGTSTTYFSQYRDSFLDHCVEVSRSKTSQKTRVWFGDKKVAAKARG